MPTSDWKVGDRVRHTAKPEWGGGQVIAAEGFLHEGNRAQRLTIRFDRAGIKTLSTVFASLAPAHESPVDEALALMEAKPPVGADPLAEAAARVAAIDAESDLVERLSVLPESATDPFAELPRRVAATLQLYRFTGVGGSLLDWAAAQTGLKDPLARFNRHQLEQHFQRFQQNLDAHLKKLMRELSRMNPAEASLLAAKAPPAAQRVLQRLDVGR